MWVAKKQNFGKPFKIWSSAHFYNVNTTWCIYKNKKPLPHSIITTLGHTQHHDKSTLTTNILINFKLKKGRKRGVASHDKDYNMVRYCDNNVRKLSDLQYSLN